jgi:hypothetical protein
MKVNNYTKWENVATNELFMVVEKWGKGFELTAYVLVNLETEETKRVEFDYMHQIISDGRLIPRKSIHKTATDGN